MRDYELLKKSVCGILSAAMVVSGGFTTVFAVNDDAVYTAETTLADTTDTGDITDTTETPLPDVTAEPTAEPTEEPTPAPEEMSMRITASVYATGETNEYQVVFKTASSLPEIDGFTFSAEFADAVISNVAFGDSFTNNGETSKSITDDKKVTYTWSNGTTACSGAVVLASATVKSSSAISSSNLSIAEFTASKSDGGILVIIADVNVVEGTSMPDLSADEQAVYEAFMAVPHLESMSFYKNNNTGELYNISSYYIEPVDEALSAYEKLSEKGMSNVDAALKINGFTLTTFTSIQKAANAMLEAEGTIQMLAAYSGIGDNGDAIDYQYLKTAFDTLGATAPSELRRAPKAESEFNEAVSQISVYNAYVEDALSKIDDPTYDNLNKKIASLKVQLQKISQFSSHAYYSTYLTSLKSNAQSLYDDVDKNYSGSYKEYMLSSIQDVISEIESGSVVISNLPTFKLNQIRVGYSWAVDITRNSALSNQDATVCVYVYDADGDLIQQSKETEFAAGTTSLTVKQVATSDLYTSGETVYVRCYYISDNISYYLGEQKTTTYSVLNPDTGNIFGGGSTDGFSTSGSSNGSNTGTIYPNTSTGSEPTSTNAPSYANENPYNDVDGYDWAIEAIIGLTNAGIVNGMGDNEFNPAGDVTREQFCKMVVLMYGLDANDTSTYFVDVDESKWYAPYVNAAVKAGFVQGQSDEYFGIGESIMRQDMATILYRAIDMTNDMIVLDFTDNDSIASYAADAVAELAGLGIINGYEDGSFKPRGSATRAEAAKVIWGVYTLIK